MYENVDAIWDKTLNIEYRWLKNWMTEINKWLSQIASTFSYKFAISRHLVCCFILAKDHHHTQLKFIYSEKATKFCEISTLSMVEISQTFVAFSEYMNFKSVMSSVSVKWHQWNLKLWISQTYWSVQISFLKQLCIHKA